MKNKARLFLTLALTFLFAFANSECMRCEASANNANSALRKAEAPGCQQNGKPPPHFAAGPVCFVKESRAWPGASCGRPGVQASSSVSKAAAAWAPVADEIWDSLPDKRGVVTYGKMAQKG